MFEVSLLRLVRCFRLDSDLDALVDRLVDVVVLVKGYSFPVAVSLLITHFMKLLLGLTCSNE